MSRTQQKDEEAHEAAAGDTCQETEVAAYPQPRRCWRLVSAPPEFRIRHPDQERDA
jgi:hypothetical protein